MDRRASINVHLVFLTDNARQYQIQSEFEAGYDSIRIITISLSYSDIILTAVITM